MYSILFLLLLFSVKDPDVYFQAQSRQYSRELDSPFLVERHNFKVFIQTRQ